MALPKTRYNFKGGKKEVAMAVQDIGQAIFAQTKVSFESAAKMVVPSIPDMVTEIIDDLSAGPLDRFSEGIKKVDNLVNELGVDLGKYSKELEGFLKLRQEKSIKSEETVNELREKNIIAQVNQMGEVQILTKQQIEEQNNNLVNYNKEIREAEKVIKTLSTRQQKGGELDEQQQKDLLAANDKLVDSLDKRNKTLLLLNKKESEDTRTFREKTGDLIDEYVPDGLRDIGSAFTEGLMAPFNAIKELGLLFGGMLKPLKALPKMLKTFSVGLLGAIAAMVPYLLIAGAIVIAIIALKKGFDFLMDNIDVVKEKLGVFADKVMEIPGQIADFFKDIFTKIKNFFIDAINGVIGMVNKVLPEKFEIEPIEREPDPSTTPVITPEQQAAKQAMTDDSAYILPKDDTTVDNVDEGGSTFETFKNLLKMLKPDSALAPAVEVGATGSGATIIDNSVKSVNQNNSQTAINLDSRNNDNSFHITNRYKDV
ncbi:hypothetical protein CMO86_04530 [Candidatus Woesearchaeota archaeon]|nr:hypothetical protein [Candidatus Woesearchaeota archaeon]